MALILTYEQAVRTSERLYAAALHLAAGKFYAQSVARGYYSVYALVDFIARRRPDWPWPTQRSGSPKLNLSHNFVPNLVYLALQATPGHGLEPRHGRNQASELLTQRVSADYFGYQELDDDTASTHLQNALRLRSVLLDTAKQHKQYPLR